MKLIPSSLLIATLLTLQPAHAALLSAADSPSSGSIAAHAPAPDAPPPPPLRADDEDSLHDELAQAQAEIAEAQAEVAHAMHEIQLAQAEIPAGAGIEEAFLPESPDAPPPPPLLPNFIGAPLDSPDAIRILRTTDLDDQATTDLREDLAVMSRLLDKAASNKPAPGHDARAMGLDLLFISTGNTPARATYLEDFGAIFHVPVNIALLPPTHQPTSTPAPKPDEDSDWDNARSEVLGNNPQLGREFQMLQDLEFSGGTARARSAPYNEAKVAELKSAILKTLKNASRIRQLKPTDHILVTLSGPGAAATGNAGRRIEKRIEHIEAQPGNPGRSTGPRVTVRHFNSPASTTLNIRVSKADADAFAKGALDLREFESRARIALYSTPQHSNPNPK